MQLTHGEKKNSLRNVNQSMKEKISTTKLAQTIEMMLASSILCWGNSAQELLGLPNLPQCQLGTID